MEWKSLGSKDFTSYQIPDRWLSIHYYEAFNILFRIENALRLFVYVILKTTDLDKWADINITSDDGNDTTIAKQAKKRMHQAKSFGYLGYDITCPIMHLTAGELSHLIFHDTYWQKFRPYFRGDKSIMQTKLDEIGSIRNALAHFRPIKTDDVDVLKQNGKHALAAIEDFFHNFLKTDHVVPTNTKEAWYALVNPVGGGPCSVRIFQSPDENWIGIRFTYQCPEISHHFYESYKTWQLLTLNTSALLTFAPTLTKHVIYLAEIGTVKEIGEGFEKHAQFLTHADFVFSKSVLAKAAPEIKVELERLVLKIIEESELVSQDHLARGILVRTANASASISGETHKYWNYSHDGLKTPLRTEDPPEYWGSFSYFGDDFIAASAKYPWMPPDISKADDDIPF